LLGDDYQSAERLQRWGDWWGSWVEAIFIRQYLDAVAGTGLVPESVDDARLLVDVYLLEKALYELRYELQYRPDWVPIPLEAILAQVGEDAAP
jgi:maltose alpha-D-glucosyltransferase / alpha-amylase